MDLQKQGELSDFQAYAVNKNPPQLNFVAQN